MRLIPDELSARFATGITTLAHAWRVRRRDGESFGFTDHDRALVVDGLVHEPLSGVRANAIEKSLGLAVDAASFSGALSAEAITEDDLARGVWDGARIDLYRVDWSAPELKLHLFSGALGEVRRGPIGFEVEVRGLQAAFNAPVGRVYARSCDADLGDLRCGVEMMNSAYRGEGVVAAVIDARAFRASGLSSFSNGWFTHGRLVWSAGGGAEIGVHRRESGAALIELLDAGGPALSLGAAFTITAGCDKTHAMCRAKFSNVQNFRGFPHMPGPDAVIAGPVAGDRHDGSKR